ncbi:hypothetical protein SDC9_47210 [bioreactor metagenome]|uniref:Uncharacterized protein n=1 Tax=bioreactor metagenome TaxID=1076179 RepID=A0A644WEM3_9ZZZZ
MIHGTFAVDSHRCDEVLHRVNTVSAHSLLTLFLKTCKAAGFFRGPEAIGFVPSNPHKIRLFRRFQVLTKATVGHAGIADSNDSKSGCPHGHVSSNLTASAR